MSTRKRNRSVGRQPAKPLSQRQVQQAIDMGWEILRCTRCQRQLRSIGSHHGESKPQPFYGDPNQQHSHEFCQECAPVAEKQAIYNWLCIADADPAQWDDLVFSPRLWSWISRRALLNDLEELDIDFANTCLHMQAAQDNADMARRERDIIDRLRKLETDLRAGIAVATPEGITVAPRNWLEVADDLSDAVRYFDRWPNMPVVESVTA